MKLFAIKRSFVIFALVLLATLAAQSHALAQDATPAPPPPACVPDEQTSCVQLTLSPAALVGDLVVADQPTPQVQQNSLWVTFTNPAAGMTANVLVTNIHDGGADDGALYMYPDIAKTITSPTAAGQTKKMTLFPVKKHIRGRVEAKCSPQSVIAGEDVSCLLTVDGVPQASPLLAGTSVTLTLDPGPHSFQFDLAGASAGLWSPPSVTKTATVYAGTSISKVTASFTKANHLLAKLSVADWVGDFYVDGTLAATQAPTVDIFVKGNANHKIEVKNIALPGAPLIHPYYDATRTFYAAANGTSNVTVTITKVPMSAMTTPTLVGDEPSNLTTQTYITWWPYWEGATAELAESGADQVFLIVTLDGVYIGDVTLYRTPAKLQPESDNDGWCYDPSWKPCYHVIWKIPLGRLAEGGHYLYAENMPFLTDVFTGFTLYPAGTSFYWESAFTVTAAP